MHATCAHQPECDCGDGFLSLGPLSDADFPQAPTAFAATLDVSGLLLETGLLVYSIRRLAKVSVMHESINLIEIEQAHSNA